MISTVCPRRANSRLSPATTSASPPTLASGASSGVTCTTYMGATTATGVAGSAMVSGWISGACARFCSSVATAGMGIATSAAGAGSAGAGTATTGWLGPGVCAGAEVRAAGPGRGSAAGSGAGFPGFRPDGFWLAAGFLRSLPGRDFLALISPLGAWCDTALRP